MKNLDNRRAGDTLHGAAKKWKCSRKHLRIYNWLMQDSSGPPEFNRMVSFLILAQAFRVCYRLVNLCRAVVIGFMQDFEYDIFLGATSLEHVPCNRSLDADTSATLTFRVYSLFYRGINICWLAAVITGSC